MTPHGRFAIPSPLLGSRRDFLRRSGGGLGLLALAGLLERDNLLAAPAPPAASPLSPWRMKPA